MTKKVGHYMPLIITEGGNALSNVSRIDSENVQKTLDDIYSKLLPAIKLKKDKIAVLGSTGKRLPGNSSGDIDIGIDKKAAKITDFEKWASGVKAVADKLDIECNVISGIHTVSLAWPIANVNRKQKGKFVQVDLMPVDDLEFNKFSKYTPQETADQPYYKSTIRNAIFEVLAHVLDVKINKFGKVAGVGDKEPVDVERYHYNLDAGIEKRHMVRKQKKDGTYNKTWTMPEKKLIASHPQKIIDTLFGKGHSVDDVESPMKAWNLAMKSPLLKDQKNKKLFLADLKANLEPKLERQGITLPPEIAKAIHLQESESIDEDGRSGQDFSSIDSPRQPLTKVHQLSGSKLKDFLKDFKAGLDDASFLIKTTPKIDGHPFRVAWIDGNVYIETSYSGLMGAEEIKAQSIPKHEQQFFEYLDKQDKKPLFKEIKKYGLTGIKILGELLANGDDFADDNGTVTYVGTTYDATKLGRVGSVVIVDVKGATLESLSDLDDKTKKKILDFLAAKFSDKNASYFDINQFAQDIDVADKDFPPEIIDTLKNSDIDKMKSSAANELKMQINAALTDIFKKKFKNPSIMKKDDKSLEGVAFQLNGNLYGIHYQSWKDIRQGYYKDIDEIKEFVKLFLAKLTDKTAGSSISSMVKEIRSDLPKYQKKYAGLYKGFLKRRKELVDKMLADKSLPKFVRSVGQDRARALISKFKDADITSDINSLLNVVVGPVKDMKGKTIAIVPGSFRPPHKGHLALIEHYSKIADEVIVAVSGQATVSSQRPDKFGRTMPNYIAGKILQIYCKAYGLSNVKIAMTMKVMQWVGWKIKTMKNVKIMLGVSGKDDISRFSAFTSDRFKKDNPDIEILPIEDNALDAVKDGQDNISATYVRQHIDDKKVLKKVLPSKLSKEQFEEVYELMNPPTGKYPPMDNKRTADSLFTPESEKAINESGTAFDDAVRINAENVDATIEDFKEKFCKFSKISKDDVVPLGSTGKRLPGQSSGDLDLGVNLTALSKKGVDIEDKNGWFEFCKKFADEAKVEYYEYKSRGLTSVRWPIANSDKKQNGEFVQVDLIPHKNLKMLQWGMYQSKEVPGQDYDKSAVRALLLQAIVKMGFLKVLKTGNVPKEGGNVPVKIERYEYKQNDGLFKMTKERPLKKDGTYGVSWKDVNKHKVTDDPQKIIDFIFGNSSYAPDNLLSVREIWDAFVKSKFYKDKKMRKLIQADFEDKMQTFKFPYPKYVKFEESMSVNEGGNAVEGVTRINKENVKATYADFVAKVLTLLKVNAKNAEIVGSAGKKDTSGDIDIGIDKVSDVRGFLVNAASVLKSKGIECTPAYGLNEVSVKWPIANADGKQKGQYVQIDIMPAKDLSILRFSNLVPDGSKTKYKTVVRNVFLERLAAFTDRKVLETAEVDGQTVEVVYERYMLITSQGLFRAKYSHKGKKPGSIVKSPTKTDKHLITDKPDEIVKILFGSNVKLEDVSTIEDCIKQFKKTKTYKDPQLRKCVIYATYKELSSRSGLDFPSFFKEGANESCISEAELDRNTLLSLHSVPEETIAEFLKKAHKQIQDISVVSIAYYPVTKSFMAKAEREDGSTFFSFFEFDSQKKKFISLDEHMYTKAEAKDKFSKIAGTKKTSKSAKNTAADMNVWVVWGGKMS